MKLLHTIIQNNKLRAITMLLVMSCLCCIMLCIRMYFTHSIYFLFLVWNLFLAIVPLGIAYYLYKCYQRYRGRYFLLVALALLWLLFLPNAPYIITDFVHLHSRPYIPLWFDVMLIFSFSITGLIAGLISLYFIHEVVELLINKITGWIFIGITTFLCGYGVYLGRVLRCNSWDLFTNTGQLLKIAILKTSDKTAIGMTLIVALFMLFTYSLFYSIISIRKTE